MNSRENGETETEQNQEKDLKGRFRQKRQKENLERKTEVGMEEFNRGTGMKGWLKEEKGVRVKEGTCRTCDG